MEELQVIETTSGRQFKPWASREDVQLIKQETVQAVVQAVQDPASITAITSEIASGKQAIAAAINAKGGSASETESFAELAEAVEEIPNLNLNGIVYYDNYTPVDVAEALVNTDKIKEFIDSYTVNTTFNIYYGIYILRLEFQKLERLNNAIYGANNASYSNIYFPELRYISGEFHIASSGGVFYAPKLEQMTNILTFYYSSNVKQIICPNLRYPTQFRGPNPTVIQMGQVIKFEDVANNWQSFTKLRRFIVGEGTDCLVIPYQGWTATSVIAEGQSGIDELNSNLYNDLLTKLYDHSQDGQTRTLRIGWLARVTAENIAYANAKGWTLTT